MSKSPLERPGIEAQPEQWREDLKQALREAFDRNLPPVSSRGAE